jgi:hypothetical protein
MPGLVNNISLLFNRGGFKLLMELLNMDSHSFYDVRSFHQGL